MKLSIGYFEDRFVEIQSNPARGEEFFESIWPVMINLPRAETRAFLDKVLDWARTHRDEFPGNLAIAYYSIGVSSFHNERFNEALSFYTQALQIFEQIGDLDGIAICSITVGNIYRTLGDFELSLKSLTEGVERLQKSVNINLSS